MIKKICLDWGNTICAVTGEYNGPMIDWPEIMLMEGAKKSLEALASKYDLYIATNAKESTIEQINAVMERVDCARYFQHYFTPREIGVGKEEVSYYHRIADKLDCLSSEILMIGDDYALDIRTPWEAGFQTAFYNPMKTVGHPMYYPLQQFEVSSWKHLEQMLTVPRPTLQESFSWLQRENGSFGLLQHVQTVASIVYWLAIHLQQQGVTVDAILAHRAGLLHDLDKLTPVRSPGDHGVLGETMLREMGYGQVAEIVGSHVIAEPAKIHLASIEAELVFFADKLVKHNQIVSVKERFDDLDARYPQNKEFRHKVEPFLMAMQENLCRQIKIDPGELLSRLRFDLMGRSAD